MVPPGDAWSEVLLSLQPFQVQRIVTAIHRSRKLITEEQALRTIRSSFTSLAAANPRAVTLSLLRCSPTCDKCAAPAPRRGGPPPPKDRDLHPTWIGTPIPHGERPPLHTERETTPMGPSPVVQRDPHPTHRTTPTPYTEGLPPHSERGSR